MPRKPKWATKQEGVPNDPHAALEDLANRLSRLEIKNGQWLARAIKQRLANDVSTLDQALGLSGRRGPKRKGASTQDLTWGKRVYKLRFEDELTWLQIKNRLRSRLDESTLRQKFERLLPDIFSSFSESDSEPTL